MSDDTERSFSSGRDLITYRRSRLLDDVIQATTCLRSWYGKPEPKTVKNKVQNEAGDWVVQEQYVPVFDNKKELKRAYDGRDNAEADNEAMAEAIEQEVVDID